MVWITGAEGGGGSRSGGFLSGLMPRVQAAAQQGLQNVYSPKRRKRNWWEADDLPSYEAPQDTYEPPPPLYAAPEPAYEPPPPLLSSDWSSRVAEFAGAYGDTPGFSDQGLTWETPEQSASRNLSGWNMGNEQVGPAEWTDEALAQRRQALEPDSFWGKVTPNSVEGWANAVQEWDQANAEANRRRGQQSPFEAITQAGPSNFRSLTGQETTDVPGGKYGQWAAEEAFNPINYAGLGVSGTGKVASLAGSILGPEYGIGKRAGVELAAGIGARVAGEEAAARLPEDIPLVPDWADPYVRGASVMGAGALGGAAAVGVTRGLGPGVTRADAGMRAVDARWNEPAGTMGVRDAGMAADEGWAAAKKPVVADLYAAVVEDLAAGKRVPVPTATRTTWLTSADSIRLAPNGADVQMFAGKSQGWVALGDDVLNHWAKVKKLKSPLDAFVEYHQGTAGTRSLDEIRADLKTATFNVDDAARKGLDYDTELARKVALQEEYKATRFPPEPRPVTPEAPVARAEPPVVPPRKPPTATAEAPEALPVARPRVTPKARREAAPPGMPPRAAAATAEFDDARNAVLEATRRESNIRKVGTAQREISEGRTRQAAGISAGLENARAMGTDVVEAARSGARTGQLRTTVAKLDITDAQKVALMDEFARQTVEGEMRQFDFLRISTALNKLVNGEGLQPAEIKMVRQVFGEEVARVATDRPLTAAQVAAKEAREIAASRKYNERAVTRQEKKAATDAQRAERKMIDEAERADRADPTADDFRAKAQAEIVKSTPDPGKQAAALAVIEEQRQIGKILLAAVPDEDGSIGKHIKATLTGQTSDSYVTTVLYRRGLITTALEQSGMDPVIAKKVAKTLMQAEVADRYGSAKKVPQVVADAMEEAKLDLGRRGAQMAQGAAAYSQMLKNTQFGVGDFAVVGVQVGHAVQMSWPGLIAANVNRVLTMMHVGIDTNVGALPREVRNTLDGLGPRFARTGMTDISHEGTLLSAVPGPTRWVDEHAVMPVIEALTNLQFNQILGRLRNTAYEGNLVLAHLARQDISNPAVRAAAAAKANADTSFAQLSVKRSRAAVEKAGLLSPSMTRAQVNTIHQVAKVFMPGTSGAERLMGSLTIIGAAGSLLAVGKALNDFVGTEDFEFDPSKPGFGTVVLPSGMKVRLFPQIAVVTGISKAVRHMESLNKEGLNAATRDLVALGVGRSSPAVQMFAKSVGIGYDPGEGLKIGDLGEGKGVGWKVLNALPLPPIASAALNGASVAELAANFVGVTAYDSTAYQRFDKKVRGDELNPAGLPYDQLPEKDQRALATKYGKPPPASPEWRAAYDKMAEKDQETAAAMADLNRRSELPTSDPKYLSPVGWRNERGRLLAEAAGYQEGVYSSLPDYVDKNVTPLDEYYTILREAGGDFDEVDKQVAMMPAEWQSYVQENLPSIDEKEGTAKEKAYWTDVNAIADSGVWDITDGRTQFLREHADVRDLMEKWGYSQNITKYLTEEDKYNQEQRNDDAKLEKGLLRKDQWKERFQERTLSLRAAGEALFQDSNGEETLGPLTGYYAAIDANTEDGQVNWRKVDQWVAAQSAETVAAIDGRERKGGISTPRVVAYREAVKKISDSGYWDMGDKIAARYTRRFGLPADTGADEMKQAVFKKEFDRFRARGMSAEEAELRADTIADRKLKGFTALLTKQRQQFRRSRKNREVTSLLAAFGWWDPGQDDTTTLLRSVA